VDQAFQTTIPGIFAAGNVVHVYDLVDWVTEAGYVAGREAARFASGTARRPLDYVRLVAGENVRYVVPHLLARGQLPGQSVPIQMRVRRPIEKPVWIELRDGDRHVHRRAERYARPGEMLTLSVPEGVQEQLRSAETLSVAVVER
jgi:hypothetical protein